MTKGQITIRVIAGGYLVYIGFNLARNSIMQKPEHYMIYLLFAAGFIILGGIWCVMALKRYLKGDFNGGFTEGKEDPEEDAPAGEDEDVVKASGEEEREKASGEKEREKAAREEKREKVSGEKEREKASGEKEREKLAGEEEREKLAGEEEGEKASGEEESGEEPEGKE